MRLRAWTIFAALALALQAATAQDTAGAAPAPTAKSGKPRTIPFASLFTTLSTDKKSKFLKQSDVDTLFIAIDSVAARVQCVSRWRARPEHLRPERAWKL